MKKNELEFFQSEIDKLGEWYQPIQFIPKKLESKSSYSFSSTLHGINKWNFILRRNLPKNLKGKRILDIGCASGLYTLSCAREGATVIGIELDKRGWQQALLTRDIYSKLDNKDYSKQVEILNQNLMEFDWEKYGKFDAVIALNVLYWIETPYENLPTSDKRNYTSSDLSSLLKKIKEHTDLFIVQCDENKYDVRKKKGGSLAATDVRMTAKLLQEVGFSDITIDRPIALPSLFRTIFSGSPEVDLKNPLYYARPILRASTR